MSIARRDYILRMIEQLAAAIARIAGLRVSGRHDEALEVLRETQNGLLGPLQPMIGRLDAASAVAMLGDASKIEAYLRLLAEEAAIYSAMRDGEKAGRVLRRLLALGREAGFLSDTAAASAQKLIKEARESLEALDRDA